MSLYWCESIDLPQGASSKIRERAGLGKLTESNRRENRHREVEAQHLQCSHT